SLDQLIEIQQQVKQVHVEDNIKEYIVSLAQTTRHNDKVYLGVSPRASIALMKAAQAYALMKGRAFVIPDDVQYLTKFVFGHRIILRPEARYEGTTEEKVIETVLRYVPVPVKRFVQQ
ncbi:MAG: MoxR family ATPase, partial [Solibacillus sp.]